MKKLLFIAIALFAISFMSCNRGNSTETLGTGVDSLEVVTDTLTVDTLDVDSTVVVEDSIL